MFAQIGYYICIPFAWLTRAFYSLTGSYGLALLLFTLVVKLVLIPFQLKSKKSMLRMNRMQGKIKDIQTRYANNKQKQQEEMSELYAREGINPMSGCLWSFLPFPILIALYSIIRMPLRYFMSMSNEVIEQVTAFAVKLGYVLPERVGSYDQINLSKFIHENWAEFAGKFDRLIDLDYNFIGIDLATSAQEVLKDFSHMGWNGWGICLMIVLAAALQLLMSVVSMKAQGNSVQGSAKTMMYMMPLMTLWFGYMLPASLCVYWAANAGFSCIQEAVLNKYFTQKLDTEESEKEREKREKRYAKMQAARENYNNRLAEMKDEKKPQQKSKKKPEEKSGEQKRSSTTENGRVGQRPYARGRAYSEDHYSE